MYHLYLLSYTILTKHLSLLSYTAPHQHPCLCSLTLLPINYSVFALLRCPHPPLPLALMSLLSNNILLTTCVCFLQQCPCSALCVCSPTPFALIHCVSALKHLSPSAPGILQPVTVPTQQLCLCSPSLSLLIF